MAHPQPLFGYHRSNAKGGNRVTVSNRRCTPDQARAIIFNKTPRFPTALEPNIYIDIWEVKRLQVPIVDLARGESRSIYWDGLDVVARTRKICIARCDQVFAQADVFFRDNPTRQELSAFLIIGIFFTHFLFTRPTNDQAEPLTDDDAIEPPTVDDPAIAELIQEQVRRLRKVKAMNMPTVFAFCERMVVRTDSGSEDKNNGIRYTLSERFKQALSFPFNSPGYLPDATIVFQPNWICPTPLQGGYLDSKVRLLTCSTPRIVAAVSPTHQWSCIGGLRRLH